MLQSVITSEAVLEVPFCSVYVFMYMYAVSLIMCVLTIHRGHDVTCVK
jgi:hypothetical protein